MTFQLSLYASTDLKTHANGATFICLGLAGTFLFGWVTALFADANDRGTIDDSLNTSAVVSPVIMLSLFPFFGFWRWWYLPVVLCLFATLPLVQALVHNARWKRASSRGTVVLKSVAWLGVSLAFFYLLPTYFFFLPSKGLLLEDKMRPIVAQSSAGMRHGDEAHDMTSPFPRKVLIWNAADNNLDSSHRRLPKDVAATEADAQFAIVTVRYVQGEIVGYYSVGSLGKKHAHAQTNAELDVVLWPEKKYLGHISIQGDMPSTSDAFPMIDSSGLDQKIVSRIMSARVP